MRIELFILMCVCSLLSSGIVRAGDELRGEEIRGRIERGLRLVEKAAASYSENRDCFSCHHQTLPMLAMIEAAEFGIGLDEKLLQQQADQARDFFSERVEKVSGGGAVGGRSVTVAYALWALDLAGRESDEVSDALVSYLLKKQEKDGSWRARGHRPPLEESDIATTFLSSYYMEQFVADGSAYADRASAAMARAEAWLVAAETKSQEDLNAKFWALEAFGAGDAALGSLREEIFAAQNEDGGWGQLPEMESDAYATGQTLFVLQEGGLERSNPDVQRGVDFLFETQQDDGSWFVQTRAKPVQKFFDNGDPHGKSQFISVAATSWATAALAALHTGEGASPEGGK